MKTLYLDCFSGISGDMFIGALIDAGGDPDYLKEQLKKLHLEAEYELVWNKTIKNGITGTKFDVLLNSQHEHNHEHHHHGHSHDHGHDHHHEHSHDHEQHHEHSHDPEHSHDHGHNHHHEHSHDHGHDHHHEHSHDHGHHHHHEHSHDHGHEHHHHEHRSYREIVRMIDATDFSSQVKTTALNIFKKIGEAEALIHGIPLDRVHFHEVGAVDSIIDIVGAAILLEHMQITSVKCSPIPVGSGKIKIDHGIYPVPAPATLEILKGIPLEHSNIRGELTTPTGAALAAVLAEDFGTLPAMKVQAVGYGAGTKSFQDQPNVLRVIIGQ